MNVLLIGAGRMGLRHLAGLSGIDGQIHVVDPNSAAAEMVHQTSAAVGSKAKIVFHGSLDDVPFDAVRFDAAILAETAHQRLDRFEQLVAAGLRNVLLEKPIEQSRGRLRQLQKIANDAAVRVHCNHWPRTLPFFRSLRDRQGPFKITVLGGAYGLGCNGAHWIDLAFYLTRSRMAKMLYGEIEDTQIESGRGTSFRDYGGCGLFAFADGSRLFLGSSADSSAPLIASVIHPTGHYLLDQEQSSIIAYDRAGDSAKPNYLYGADYGRREVIGAAKLNLSDLTRSWIESLGERGECSLPTLDEAVLAHESLFDLLETSGETVFPIT